MMRKTYHLCLSAGKDGLLCRKEEDYIRMVNSICLAALRTGTDLLAYSVMSSHVHICARTQCQNEFIACMKYMFTRYFNNCHHRTGRLGESKHFVLELNGLYHTLAAISYVLRNPLHHGVAATPFDYRFSSVNAVFRTALGKSLPSSLPRKSMYRYLPDSFSVPDHYMMDESGLLIPDCVTDVADVEHLYVTPRSFLYYMNRLSGKSWEEEQGRDASGDAPVTLLDIEKGTDMKNIQEMLVAEYGKADYNAASDIDVCKVIDDYIGKHVPGVRSIYELSEDSRKRIAGDIRALYLFPKSQLSRCLFIK